MDRIKKEVKEGSTFLNISVHDLIEVMLFVLLLGSVLGALFREKFMYLIFAAILIFVWLELRKYKREKMVMEAKLDKRIADFESMKKDRKKRKKR